MSREIALDSPAAVAARRQPLLASKSTSSAPNKLIKNSGGSCRRSRMGETAGECTALCCCCPCAMLHLLILAVYRLPRGIWRKKKRSRLLMKTKKKISAEEKGNHRKPNAVMSNAEEETTEDEDSGDKNDAVDWDNEMWDRFYGAGFWRSASQRNDDDD